MVQILFCLCLSLELFLSVCFRISFWLVTDHAFLLGPLHIILILFTFLFFLTNTVACTISSFELDTAIQ